MIFSIIKVHYDPHRVEQYITSATNASSIADLVDGWKDIDKVPIAVYQPDAKHMIDEQGLDHYWIVPLPRTTQEAEILYPQRNVIASYKKRKQGGYIMKQAQRVDEIKLDFT